MREISYIVLAFGVLGIALGLYGWLFPTVRDRIASLLHNNDDDDLADDETELAGDLESRRASALARLEARRSAVEVQRSPRPPTPGIAPSPPLPTVAASVDEPDDHLDPFAGEPTEDEEVVENPVRVVKLEAPPVAEAPPEVTGATSDLASVLEEPPATPAPGDNDMLAFFAEAAEESSTSPVLREAIEVVSAQELLEDARALRALISGSADA